MGKIVRSAKGEKVDFDLLAIKSTMAAMPITDTVSNRERFINKKRRRGLKRIADDAAKAQRLEKANFTAAIETDAAAEAVAEEAKQPKQRRKVGA